MKRFIGVLSLLFVGIVSMSAQIRFSATANVYNEQTNQKIGTQYIAANIDAGGKGTMTLGSLTMKATVTNSTRNNTYKISAYSATLRSSNGQKVDVVINIYDEGYASVLVYYAEGTMRYDFTIK